MAMQASKRAYDLLRRFEGLRLHAYQCQAGRWTIGYGHTDGVTSGMTVTRDEAEALLEHDVWTVDKALLRLTNGLELTNGQWDALVCLTFNIGTAALASSTLLRLLRNGATTAAAQEFLRWDKVHAGGVMIESAGLKVRRLAEQALFIDASTQREPAA